jgi:uncharacterized protein (DUF1778 family)
MKHTRTAIRKSASLRSVGLEMKIDQQAKDLLERAAAMSGLSLADYAASNLVHAAMQTIERHERLILSEQDRDRFLAALDCPENLLPALENRVERLASDNRGVALADSGL